MAFETLGAWNPSVPNISFMPTAFAKGLMKRGLQDVFAYAQVILYSFPAICWLYGAGFVFSTFVSVVFWGASAQQLWESLRKHSTIVRPMGLQVRTLLALAPAQNSKLYEDSDTEFHHCLLACSMSV